MVRPKNNDLPTYMWPDGDRGGFVVVNPITGKKKRFTAAHEQQARDTAKLLNEYLEKRRQRQLLDAGRLKLNDVIDRVIKETVPLQPWDESTRTTALQRLARIKREQLRTDETTDERCIEDINSVQIGKWLAKTAPRADPFNKWRNVLVLIWGFAVAEGIVPTNEAEKIQPRSLSRKIESNKKRRQPLDVQGFEDIHAKADALLKLAMETSLVTTLSRNEVCEIQHTHFRDGWLYVIRDKTSGDSDMAFIRIEITPELESIRARARKLGETKSDDAKAPLVDQALRFASQGISTAQIADRLGSTSKKIGQLLWWARKRRLASTDIALASPYLIHRRPARMQRRWTEGKPHWTYVEPAYLTHLFALARDKVPRFSALPERERPTFHEIRGLAARLAEAHGMSKKAIQLLMTHADKKTTEIYLDGGREALTDDHFIKVSAPFTVRELLGG